ncbi:MAG TPA: MaoC family dehydratase [Rhodospirillales bacterium]|nr:MaoC family dehydratase [Rhodospirillales bacterium]
MTRDLWLDDFRPGQRFTTAGATLSEAQIMAFAFEWDPQPFHIDKLAAAESPFGGIIASGFHTLLVAFRLILQERIFNAASMGSPGMEEIRWRLPVRPDDTLRVEGEVLEVRPSRSRPDRGTARIAYEVKNQHGETVMSFTVTHILRRAADRND